MTLAGAATAAVTDQAVATVDLLWIPLGAGGRSIHWNGRLYEYAAARRAHRSSLDLYHSALQIRIGQDCFVIEMAPAWGSSRPDRGVTAVGPVGMRQLGRLRAFRYEVRCWRDGAVPDAAAASGGGRRLVVDPRQAASMLDLVPQFPARTWGRDEQHTGDMWNSNSLTAWLLARSGQDMTRIAPPVGGRAPGWQAGLTVAGRKPLTEPRELVALP